MNSWDGESFRQVLICPPVIEIALVCDGEIALAASDYQCGRATVEET